MQVYHLLAEKQLPGPINAKRACKECSHLTSCSMYQKLENNIPSEPHAMSELVPTVLDHLTSEDVEFFNKVCNFTKYLKTQTNSLLLFHSNLDIVNKSVRPFLFTILNNSYISNVICLPSKSSKWELGFVHYIMKFTILRFIILRFECKYYI